MESFNTIVLDLTEMVDELKQARKKKLKKYVEKTPMRCRSTMKGKITQSVESFIEVVKSLIESRKVVNPANELHDSLKTTIDILNSTKGVKVATPFWVSTMEVLKYETKLMLWVQMPESARWPWMTKQINKMNRV